MNIPSPPIHPKALMAIAMGAFLLLCARYRPDALPPTIHTLEGASMGTTWEIQVSVRNDEAGPDAALGEQVIAELDRLDKGIFSTYVTTSELSRVNTTPVGEEIAVSRELQEVLLLSATIHKQSFRLFDVTVGPLVNLWGFGPAPREGVPETAAIEAAKAKLGADRYLVNARAGTVKRTADITLDLSAIAKGYVVDKVADLLLEHGFTDFLVEIGGEVRVQGMREPERDWTIAMETPEPGEQVSFAQIHNAGQGFALAGSGDYRNFFEQDGKRYSHEIDPRTGYPIDHALAAVTVLADTAAEADAWATALMVAGPDDAMLLAEHRELAAFFIIRGIDSWESRYTSGFEPYLKNAGDLPDIATDGAIDVVTDSATGSATNSAIDDETDSATVSTTNEKIGEQ